MDFHVILPGCEPELLMCVVDDVLVIVPAPGLPQPVPTPLELVPNE